MPGHRHILYHFLYNETLNVSTLDCLMFVRGQSCSLRGDKRRVFILLINKTVDPEDELAGTKSGEMTVSVCLCSGWDSGTLTPLVEGIRIIYFCRIVWIYLQ